MSRIGKQPVAIPPQVKVEVKGQTISVAGPKGKLDMELPRRTSLKVADGHAVYYWTLTGTNNGPFMGKPATKKQVNLHGVDIDVRAGIEMDEAQSHEQPIEHDTTQEDGERQVHQANRL